MYDMNAFSGGMPQFPMAGGSGFAGDFEGLSGLVQPDPRKKKRQGMFGAAWPMFGLTGMLAHGGMLGDVAPLLGGLAGFGISRLMK